LIDAGHRVLYMRTSELVQRLQAARQNLQLPQALTKLDRYDLLILDDLSYVRKDQAETSVRRSILITANQPFSGWDNVFPDPGMTVAAIDRLVHHSTIFELHQVESYRGKEAARQQKIQRDNEKEKTKHARQTAGTA
jgi:DNA replication protein DnaC